MFTSTLSVSEFALLSELQTVPLRQVMGVSVQQIGWQYLPPQARWGGDELFCELDRIGHAWDQARRQALDRMAEEARDAGADAVVGVRVQRGDHDLGDQTVDFVVTGTAVRWPGSARAGWPVLSDLSAQDYWKLWSAGWMPVGLATATAVYFISQGFSTRWQRRMNVASNQELVEFSDAFAAARRAAVRYVASQADAAGGDGVVGVSIEHQITHGSFKVMPAASTQRLQFGPSNLNVSGGGGGGSDARDGLVITISAVGTAVRRTEPVPNYPPETTLAVTR